VDAVEHGGLCPVLQRRYEEYRVFNPQTPISGSDIEKNLFYAEHERRLRQKLKKQRAYQKPLILKPPHTIAVRLDVFARKINIKGNETCFIEVSCPLI
jgi:hypothetical protein